MRPPTNCEKSSCFSISAKSCDSISWATSLFLPMCSKCYVTICKMSISSIRRTTWAPYSLRKMRSSSSSIIRFIWSPIRKCPAWLSQIFLAGYATPQPDTAITELISFLYELTKHTSSYIKYVNANYLDSWAMPQRLPDDKFEWVSNDDCHDSYAKLKNKALCDWWYDQTKHYILEVDLDYSMSNMIATIIIYSPEDDEHRRQNHE